MRRTLIGLDERERWDAALDRVPHAFWHTWTHCAAMATSSGQRTRLHVLEDADLHVVCPVAERVADGHIDLVTPYGFSGFVGTSASFALGDRWADLARADGAVCGYFVLNPILTPPEWLADEASSDRDVFVLDLSLGDDALFERLDVNRKRQLRRAWADGGWRTDERDRLADFFVREYPAFMRRREAAAVYALGEESLRQLCEAPGTVLVGAQRGGRVRAVSLFGYTRHAGDFLFNVSLPGEEAYSAPLIWAGMQALRAAAVPTLNLGGGVSAGDGVERFKGRFGADRVPLRTLRQIYRPDLYADLCRRAGADPRSTGYFPAYRTAR